MLTILIPTHNRLDLLLKAICSIRTIFADVQIIVADNSSIHYSKLPNLGSNIQIIDTRQYEGDISIVFKALINNVNTKYSLIVQDDDILVNAQFHQKMYQLLNSNRHVMSFAAYVPKTNDIFLKHAFYGTFYGIPSFWHGNFQFGMCYYPTYALKYAIHKWFDINHEYRIFEQSYDEAIALLAIAKSKGYTHFSEIGMNIGVNNDNMSWNNILYRIYSSVTYIDDVADLLKLPNKWRDNYKDIQFLDIIDEFKNVSKDDIFNNNEILNIRKEVINKLVENKPLCQIQKFILDEMEKKFNI